MTVGNIQYFREYSKETWCRRHMEIKLHSHWPLEIWKEGSKLPLHPPTLQSIVSSRAGQAAPPNCGCWTTSLARVFLPPLQGALHSLVSLQSLTSQSTRQNTFNVLPPTVYQNLVIMVITMDVCLNIRIFWFHWSNNLSLIIYLMTPYHDCGL